MKVSDLKDKKVIATSFFRHQKDPQHNKYVPDSYEYIKEWASTCSEVVAERDDVVGLVFCSEVSLEVRRKIEENAGILTLTYAATHGYSTNDERFFCYLDFLKEAQPEAAFFTDGNDVKVRGNPFELFEKYDKTYFIGKDMEETPHVGSNPWAKSKLAELKKLCGQPQNSNEKFALLISPLYNAGVIGGRTQALIDLFEYVCYILKECGTEGNNNMMALHLSLLRLLDGAFKDHILTGRPLTSPFKKYRDTGKFYFVHK